MTENDCHHFILTTTIYGYGTMRVIIIDAYMVAFVDHRHFIFLVKVEKCHQSSLVMVKRALTKNCSSPFHIDVRA